MLDSNWKNWILGLAIIMGLMFEVIKHAPGTETSELWKGDNFRLTNLIPYSVQNLMGSKPKKHAPALLPAGKPVQHVASNAEVEAVLKKFIAENTPQQTEADKKKAKKKKDDDEYEEVIDPETGKKVRRKKKKDESKDEKKAEQTTDTAADQNLLPQVPPPSNEDIPAAVAAAAAAAAANGVPGLPAGAGAEPNNFKTLAEWEALLLSQPNLSATQQFISQYKENLVPASTFYQIVKAMMADKRTDMQNLGVLAAGETPSVTSFQILADEEKAQPSGQLNTETNQYLTMYGKNLNDLSILQGVLRGSDTYAAAVAAQELDASAKTFLTSGTQTGNPSTQGTTVANAARFQPFLSILQGLENSPDPNLDSQARQTLTDLQSLLGSSANIAGGLQSANFEEPFEQ